MPPRRTLPRTNNIPCGRGRGRGGGNSNVGGRGSSDRGGDVEVNSAKSPSSRAEANGDDSSIASIKPGKDLATDGMDPQDAVSTRAGSGSRKESHYFNGNHKTTSDKNSKSGGNQRGNAVKEEKNVKVFRTDRILRAFLPKDGNSEARHEVTVRIKLNNKYFDLHTKPQQFAAEDAENEHIQVSRKKSESRDNHVEDQNNDNEEDDDHEPVEEPLASRLPRRKRNTVFSSLSPAVMKATSMARAEAALAAEPEPQLGSSRPRRNTDNIGGDIDEENTKNAGAGTKPTPDIRDGDDSQRNPAAIATAYAVSVAGHVPKEFLGRDGNLFYCKVCLGVGEVVCCDGCPYVFHPQCIPNGLSKSSLENDDDPWFCHDCVEKGMLGKSIGGSGVIGINSVDTAPTKNKRKKKRKTAEMGEKENDVEEESLHASPSALKKQKRRKLKSLDQDAVKTTSKRKKCSLCRKKADDDHPAIPCSRKNCNRYFHFPSCPGIQADNISSSRPLEALCSYCKNDELMDDEGLEVDDEHDTIASLESPASREHGRVSGRGKGGRGGRGRGGRGGRSVRGGRGGRGGRVTGRVRGSIPSPASEHIEFAEDDFGMSDHESDNGDYDYGVKMPSKRKRATPPSDQRSDDEYLPEKRKSGKPKRPVPIVSEEKISFSGYQSPYREEDMDEDGGPASLAFVEKPLSSTPAFFFFLLNNKSIIEKSLLRKSRSFRGIPKGLARNELIAKEGAAIWMELSLNEKREYVDYAVKDFEKRVIAWKEKEVIEGMVEAMDEENDNDGGESEDKVSDELSLEEETSKAQSKARLLQSSKVKCQKVQISAKDRNTNNRILLELLNDVRFRPLPLLTNARAFEDLSATSPSSKGTIQQFTVQGPIETSVGDECSGCARGWDHFCPVLKRPIPTSEHRCKLQPPVSSLMATRIGLGLKLNLPHQKNQGTSNGKTNNTACAIGSANGVVCSNYQARDSLFLSDPSFRSDDTCAFIESAMAVKTIKYNRDGSVVGDGSTTEVETEPASSSTNKRLSRGILPLRGRKKSNTVEDDHDVDRLDLLNDKTGNRLYRCGSCGTFQSLPFGCIPCRRNQLVTEMAQHDALSSISLSEVNLKSNSDNSGHYGAGFLRPRCVMLKRTQISDTIITSDGQKYQLEGREKLGHLQTRRSWKPNVILPHTPKHIPTPKLRSRKIDQLLGSDSSTSDESASIATGSSNSKQTKREPDKKKPDTKGTGVEPDILKEDVVSNGFEQSNETDDGRRSRLLARSCTNPKHNDSESTDLQDRQSLAVKQKESANDLSRKCLGIACCGILVGMIRRDPLRLFAEPVPSDIEEYHKVIKEPIDFQTMRKKVLASEYSSLGAFINDARRLCINACVFNAADSLYAKTAKQIFDSLIVMQKRAQSWISALKNAHATSFILEHGGDDNESSAFKELKSKWPGAVELLENGDWLKKVVESDFVRTRENECAYYGALAIRRAAAAADISLAMSPGIGGVQRPVVRRSHIEDDCLRKRVDDGVSLIAGPVQLIDEPDWREKQIMKLLKRVQKRRIDARTSSESGCARCDSARSDDETSNAVSSFRRKFKRKADEAKSRVADSRLQQSTGLASRKVRMKAKEKQVEDDTPLESIESVDTEKVSVRGSQIHGWGLFADYPFKKGEVVAEYIGEYISNAVADAREKYYRKRRIQDYQFRVDDNLVIDATLNGGHARYINHSCSPNCVAKIVNGKKPNEHLKRVMIVSQRDIQSMEELSYDYQFPLELDLDLRIPCSCGAKQCRGYMNWDIPENASIRSKINNRGRIDNNRGKGRMNKV